MSYSSNKAVVLAVMTILTFPGYALCSAAEHRKSVPLEEIVPESSTPSPPPRSTLLPDKINAIVDQLDEDHPVHYYRFVAVRGQDVLLSVLEDQYPYKAAWKIEYSKDDQW